MSLKTFEIYADYWSYTYEYNDRIKTVCGNKNSTMNKKITNEFYLPIQ